jgi:flagellar hook-basal body complex protein FliE
MKIFGNDAYIGAARNYQLTMQRTHSNHMGPLDSPYAGGGNNILKLEKTIGAEGITGAGSFEQAMLQALDKVSSAQQWAGYLAQEAIVNPDSVDVQDITIAQAEANMSLNIARNILSRLVQGWRDLINIR